MRATRQKVLGVCKGARRGWLQSSDSRHRYRIVTLQHQWHDAVATTAFSGLASAQLQLVVGYLGLAKNAKVRAGRARRFSQPANARPKSEYFTRCSPPQSSVALDHYTDGSQVSKVHTSVQRPGTATGGVTAGRRRGGGGEHCLLDVLAEELAMEVVTHGVVNEAALLLLRLARLVLEDHVVVPPGTR